MKLHDLFSEAAKAVRVIDTGAAWQVMFGSSVSPIRYTTKAQAEQRASYLRTVYVFGGRVSRALTAEEIERVKQHTGRGGCWRANCRAALREIEGRKQKYRGVEV